MRTLTAIATLSILCGSAGAHEAHTIQGEGLGVQYPLGCCWSAANAPKGLNGDCAPISEKYVTAGPDGYHVNLPVGSHPQLKKRGYSGVVPYSAARQPLSDEFHICLSPDGASRRCFFPKPFGS